MKLFQCTLLISLLLALSSCEPAPAAAIMFDGTIFVDPDIITNTDPSMYSYLTPAGSANRQMYDNRVNAWTEVKAVLFTATYTNGRKIEMQVNPEFGNGAAARSQAEFYAKAIGLLPQPLLKDVLTVAIQKGNQAFGGGNSNLLIHTDRGAEYISQGILEETLFHEAAHTSLDPYFLGSTDWSNAQSRDGRFISNYARQNPNREDIAESVLLYFGVTYRSQRMDPMMVEAIKVTMPNRIDFFHALNLQPLTWEAVTEAMGADAR